MTDFRRKLALGAAILAVLGAGSAALAQRDPAYEAARAAGQVGERTDGYLGIVGASTPDLERLVSNINKRRKEIYAEKAPAATPPATLEEYATASGCAAILRTVPGEKYQAPDGTWKTRTSAPPERDLRCV